MDSLIDKMPTADKADIRERTSTKAQIAALITVLQESGVLSAGEIARIDRVQQQYIEKMHAFAVKIAEIIIDTKNERLKEKIDVNELVYTLKRQGEDLVRYHLMTPDEFEKIKKAMEALESQDDLRDKKD